MHFAAEDAFFFAFFFFLHFLAGGGGVAATGQVPAQVPSSRNATSGFETFVTHSFITPNEVQPGAEPMSTAAWAG